MLKRFANTRKCQETNFNQRTCQANLFQKVDLNFKRKTVHIEITIGKELSYPVFENTLLN